MAALPQTPSSDAGQAAAGASAAPALLKPTAAAARRARRARLARRLLERSPDAAGALDWPALDRLPDWLTLPDEELTRLQRRTGALLYADAVRLWIDGPRLTAAREGVGEAFLGALRAQPRETSMPTGLLDVPPIDAAPQVAPTWQAAGASVLLASVAHGPRRQAAAALLAPAAPSAMAPELAASLVARAIALQATDAPDGAAS